MLTAVLVVGLIFFLIGIGFGIAGTVMYSQSKKAGVTPSNTTVGFMIGGWIVAVVGLAILLTGVFVKKCPKVTAVTAPGTNDVYLASGI